MCGVFGVFGHAEAEKLTYLGLHALQHRGQESAGIASSDGAQIYVERYMGLVGDVFDAETLQTLPGRAAIGHVRYSTTGTSHIKNAQPVTVSYARGQIAVAHNGDLVNAAELRHELEADGSIFQATTDTEVIVHLMARAKGKRAVDRVSEALSQVRGDFSLLFLTEDELIAARAPMRFRPLALGRLGRTWVVASETCAFDLIGARFRREIEPGEVLSDRQERRALAPPVRTGAAPHLRLRARLLCAPLTAFSTVERLRRARGDGPSARDRAPGRGRRRRAGAGLGRAGGHRLRAAVGIAGLGFVRSHYVGRTFIEPRQAIRHFGVRLKLNAIREVVAAKRVVVVDDSIVRGTTSRKIFKMLRAAGAREVHLRISSPPTKFPCYYGIDTPTRRELIASTQTIAQIAKYVTCDSLGYLSREGLMAAVGSPGGANHCDACFTGRYPVTIPADRLRQGKGVRKAKAASPRSSPQEDAMFQEIADRLVKLDQRVQALLVHL